MALDKQLIDLSTQSGIDTKSDPNNLAPPQLSDLLNMRFDYTGALNPRDQFGTIGAVTGSNPNYVLGLRGVVYAEMDQRLYQIADTVTSNLSPNWSPHATRVALSSGQFPTTAALTNGIITVWQSSDGFGYQILDENGVQLTGRNYTVASVQHVFVTAGPNNTPYIWVQNQSDVLLGFSVSGKTVTALTIPSITAIESFSIIYSALDNGFWVAYSNLTTVFVNKWTVSGTTVSAIGAAVTVVTALVRNIDILRTTSYVAVSFAYTSSAVLGCAFYTTALSAVATQTQAISVLGQGFGFGSIQASPDRVAITVTPYSTTTGGYLIAVLATISAMTVVHNSRSVTFIAETGPMVYQNGIYISAIDTTARGFHTSALVLVIDLAPSATTTAAKSVVCFWSSGSSYSGFFINNGAISVDMPRNGRRISAVSSGIFIPGAFLSSDVSFNYTTWPGSSNVSFLYGSSNRIVVSVLHIDISKIYAPALHQLTSSNSLAAANLLSLDGTGAGPGCLWPNFLPPTASTTTAGVLADGVYFYVFEKFWLDSAGNIQRLETPPIKIEIIGGVFNKPVFYLPAGAFDIPNTASNGVDYASINMYRTETNGTIPYFSDLYTIASAGTLTTFNANVEVSRPLPSSSGELQTATPPAIRASVQWKGRIAALVADSDTAIWYTKPSVAYEFTSFANGLEIDVAASNRPLNAITTMDGVLYAFNTNQVFTIYGDPAGATGEGGSITLPELRFNGVGCQDPASVIQTPKGIFFKSDKGFYVILRNQELVFVGTGPFSSRGETIVGAWADKERSEVGFIQSNGEAWVYDWEAKGWTRWVLPTGASEPITGASLIDDHATYITADGVYQTTSTTTGEDIPISLTTGWVKLGSLQGYQRLYQLWLLFGYLAEHTLTIDMYVDYSDTIVKTWTIPSTGLSTLQPQQINLSVPVQKCEAFKLKISSPTPGWKLTGLTAEVGIKPTSYKPRQPHNAY